MPTRLLNLVDGVRLCSPGQPVPFAALSYCWGTGEQSITTKANLQTRLDEIDPSELPQTLQDGVLVCRGLGLSYIWIDSLCIIQDDEADWAAESAEMASLYSHAHIVLAATLAAGADDGFLRPRDPPLKSTLIKKGRHALNLEARRMRNHYAVGPPKTLIHDLPLSRRGWAMQEGLLATRILHFCRDEVLYHCKTSLRCECRREDLYHDEANDGRDMPPTWPPTSIEHDLPYRAHDDTGFIFTLIWDGVVREYSSRRLTFPDDTLPALSGIAQRTQTVQLGQYIAGMWERGFIFQLGWSDFATEASQKSPPLKPTFSWITARDTVWYDNGLSWDEMPYPACTLLHAHVVPATVDPFGRVASARVTLSGKTVLGSGFFQEVRNREVDKHVDSLCIWIDKFNGPLPGSIPEPDLRFEVFNESCDWTSVICLGLYSGLVKGVGKITMLLLQPEFGTDSYVRVGLVSYMEKDWFDQRAIERTVVVV